MRFERSDIWEALSWHEIPTNEKCQWKKVNVNNEVIKYGTIYISECMPDRVLLDIPKKCDCGKGIEVV